MTHALIDSLELASGRTEDLSPAVYARYFARCEGSQTLMSHVDDGVRGKMLNEVIRLMMEPTLETEATYLDFEVDNHRRAYMVEPHMYENLFTALRDTVKETVGSDWTPEMEAAWHERLTELDEAITQRYPSRS